MAEDEFDRSWIDAFAASLGQEPLSDELIESLLALAGRAAHGSGDRRNAPLACHLAGRRVAASSEPTTPEVIDAM